MESSLVAAYITEQESIGPFKFVVVGQLIIDPATSQDAFTITIRATIIIAIIVIITIIIAIIIIVTVVITIATTIVVTVIVIIVIEAIVAEATIIIRVVITIITIIAGVIVTKDLTTYNQGDTSFEVDIILVFMGPALIYSSWGDTDRSYNQVANLAMEAFIFEVTIKAHQEADLVVTWRH